MPGTRNTVMKETEMVPADSECERNASGENRGIPESTPEGLLTPVLVPGRSSRQDPGKGPLNGDLRLRKS